MRLISQSYLNIVFTKYIFIYYEITYISVSYNTIVNVHQPELQEIEAYTKNLSNTYLTRYVTIPRGYDSLLLNKDLFVQQRIENTSCHV